MKSFVYRIAQAALLGTVATFAACATSSQTFVEEQSGYAVTRGRITQIENLTAAEVQPLSDGVAVKLSQPGCRVAIRFPDQQSKVMDLGAGVILVHGYDHDYVLQAAPGQPR